MDPEVCLQHFVGTGARTEEVSQYRIRIECNWSDKVFETIAACGRRNRSDRLCYRQRLWRKGCSGDRRGSGRWPCGDFRWRLDVNRRHELDLQSSLYGQHDVRAAFGRREKLKHRGWRKQEEEGVALRMTGTLEAAIRLYDGFLSLLLGHIDDLGRYAIVHFPVWRNDL